MWPCERKYSELKIHADISTTYYVERNLFIAYNDQSEYVNTYRYAVD